jgi:hypothetical protein
VTRPIKEEILMTLPFLSNFFELGLATTGALLFLSLLIASEIGYRVGRPTRRGPPVSANDLSAVATLTAGMIALLAFTLSLSLSFAQNRYETRRGLVLEEANAIQTAWLRTKLIDGAEGPAIAAKIEDYARVRLDFIRAASDADVPALVARADALQRDIWQTAQVLTRRLPDPVTAALVSALNQMFDDETAQRFAYASRVPADIMLGLYFGALLSIAALSYQFSLAGTRHFVLLSLLLLMWSGGMLLIIDLNLPRTGRITPDVAPMAWTIQGFGPK